MAVVVFDADVLIAFLARDDTNHAEAIRRVRAALVPGMRRVVSAVNYSEILVGPLRAGGDAPTKVDAMLAHFSVDIAEVDADAARRAAEVRARTNLKLPDAYALAAAIDAEQRGWEDVHIETFDERVLKAYASRDDD